MIEDIGISIKAAPVIQWDGQKMDNALALALIESEGLNCINFRKGGFSIGKKWMEYKSNLIQSGILLVLIFAAFFAYLLIDSNSKEKTLNRLNTQIADVFMSTFPDVKKVLDPAKQMRIKLDEIKKTAPATVETKKNVYSIDILDEISSRVPDDVDVLLSRLVIDNDNVLVSGDTPTFNTVDDLKSRLEESPIFKKVTISSANMEKSGKRVRFKLKLQL